MQTTLMALAGSFIIISLLLMMTASFHALAFRPQMLQLQPSSFSLPLQPIQQQATPGLVVPDQQPQQKPSPPLLSPSPAAQPSPAGQSPTAVPKQGPIEGVTTNGTINSLIYAPTTHWIATGNWKLGINNRTLALYTTNMTWYNSNGTTVHTHEFRNFRSTEIGQPIIVQPDKSLFLRGVMDVGTNNRIVWKDVQSTIDIKGGKTILISVNDTQTNRHFVGQPVYGVVTSFTPCSDAPLPNMEVLPPCLSIPISPPAPPSASAASSPSLTATPPASIPPPASSPTVPANSTASQVQNPNNFTASSPPPSSPSLSSPSGNITTNIPTASNATNSTTGKSPFDILGGG